MRLNVLLRAGVKIDSQYQEYGDDGLMPKKPYFGYDNDTRWQHQALLQIDTDEGSAQVYLNLQDHNESSQVSVSVDMTEDKEKNAPKSSKTSSHIIDTYA